MVSFVMELDQEGAENHQHAQQDTISTPSTADSDSNPSPNVPVPVSAAPEADRRSIGHDSLVTVRLSEPPALHVNTDVPTSSLPARRSLYGNEYTPTDAMAEAVAEEDDSSSDDADAKTPSSERGRSLQDELQGGSDDEEHDEEADQTQVAEVRQSADSDKVNWDQLQESEDEEAKDHDAENVGSFVTWWPRGDADSRATVYSASLGSFGAREQQIGDKSQERQGPSCRGQAGTRTQPAAEAAVNGAATANGQRPSAGGSAILDASASPHDRSRILHGLGQRPPTDSCALANAAVQ
jgi:hypothetical protein